MPTRCAEVATQDWSPVTKQTYKILYQNDVAENNTVAQSCICQIHGLLLFHTRHILSLNFISLHYAFCRTQKANDSA